MNEIDAHRLSDLFDRMTLGFLVADPGRKQVVWQNQAMRNLFPPPPLDYPRAEELFLSEFRDEEGEKAASSTLELPERTIGFSVHAAGDGLRLVLAAAVADQERQQRTAEINSMMSVLDYLFFSLAHELGNPINSIKMTLEVLINNFGEYSDSTRLDYLRSIHEEFKRLEELLKAIRSFNVFEHLNIRPTNVGELLENLLQLLGDEIRKNGIATQVDIDPGPLLAACDPRALHQVFLNLVDNAIDAMAGTRAPRVHFRVKPHDGQVRIVIADNGCGIPEHRKREMFLPFFSGKPKGIGLGLVTVKKLLAQMNGTIEIDSRLNQGTEVRITLPAASVHEP